MNRQTRVYFPHIDFLRAIAVLSVVVFHMNPHWLPGGFLGVDVFFVISGFIVSAACDQFKSQKFSRFVINFYARRFQRLTAGLVVCLLLTSLASMLFIPEAWLSTANREAGYAAFFGLSNFVLANSNNDYFAEISEYNPFTHTWTLGVEEQFYLIFPWLFLLWLKGGQKRRFSLAVFACITIGSLAWSAWSMQKNPTHAYYMITSRFWELSSGILLYQCMQLFHDRTKEDKNQSWYGYGALLSLALLAMAFAFANESHAPFPDAIAAVIGTLGFLFFLHKPSKFALFASQTLKATIPNRHSQTPVDLSSIRKILSATALWIGKASYSIYLYHWPVMVIMRWTIGLTQWYQYLLALVFTFVLASLSYYWIERPFRNIQWQPQNAYRVIVIGLLVLVAGWQLSKATYKQRQELSFSTVSRHENDWYAGKLAKKTDGCDVDSDEEPLSIGEVRIIRREDCPPVVSSNTSSVKAPNLFALGDSHTRSYATMFKLYALNTGATVRMYARDSMSFIKFKSTQDNDEDRQKQIQASLEDIKKHIKSGDIIFLASLRIPQMVGLWTQYDPKKLELEVFSPEAVLAREQATQQAIEIVRNLTSMGAKVVFEAPPPVFKIPPFRCAEPYNQSIPICLPGPNVSRSEIEHYRAPVLAAMQRVIETVPNTYLWDPFPILCPSAPTCNAFKDGKPLFFDGDHMSAYGSSLVAPSFIETLQKLNI